MNNEILIIPDKEDVERDSIAEIWKQLGGEVMRIGKFWIKPETSGKRVSLYGYDSFCLVLAQILEIDLMMPKDELIGDFEMEFVKRNIEIKLISDINKITFPKFVKPVTPKLFKAEIFESANKLLEVIEGIELDQKIICSDIVKVDKEIRSFILSNKIADIAFYEGAGNLNEPTDFIRKFLETNKAKLPNTYVLDLGFNNEIGWFVIELNSSWGAGLNNCDPAKVVKCIRGAAVQ